MPRVLSSVYICMNILKDTCEKYGLVLPLPIWQVQSKILHYQQHLNLRFLLHSFAFDACNSIGYAFAHCYVVLMQYFFITNIAQILMIKQSILVGDLKLMNDSAQIEEKQPESKSS